MQVCCGWFEAVDATNVVFVKLPAAGFGLAITACNFEFGEGGSMATNMFQVDGINFVSFTASHAAYPGNIANFA